MTVGLSAYLGFFVVDARAATEVAAGGQQPVTHGALVVPDHSVRTES